MDERTFPVREIFAEVPRTYERANRVLTFGFDGAWRRSAARAAAEAGGSAWLDVCTGTGDMAVALERRMSGRGIVVGADFSRPMLRKAAERSRGRAIALVEAAAGSLPFRDGTFDLVTMSFATRNCNTSRGALIGVFAELRRVLRPGGILLNLETSQPPSGVVRALFHRYARSGVARIGRFISGSRAGYAYLSYTLSRFYDADELASVIAEAGFSSVSYRRLTLGVAALHRAVNGDR